MKLIFVGRPSFKLHDLIISEFIATSDKSEYSLTVGTGYQGARSRIWLNQAHVEQNRILRQSDKQYTDSSFSGLIKERRARKGAQWVFRAKSSSFIHNGIGQGRNKEYRIIR